MDFAAPHVGFVAAAYGLSALFLCGLTIWAIARDAKLRAKAERLERQRRKGDA
jgi:heme exporter protein CcmD